MGVSKAEEHVRLWRMEGEDGVELMRATYVRQSFPRHSHDCYCFGVVERGALGFRYRGENVVAFPGEINLAVPGEAHTGQAASDEGWTYRMFYVDPGLLATAAAECGGRRTGLPFFRPGVIRNPRLARKIYALHKRLEGKTPVLKREEDLIGILEGFVREHAEERSSLRSAGQEPGPVGRVRDYIEDYSARDISIRELAAVAGLSPYHFIRVFRDHTGLSPYEYLIQTRVRKARSLLRKGQSAARTALETGFFDQSHLTRHFRKVLGVTPGQYRNIVQSR